MAIKTPNNYFAEATMGGITSDLSAETTINGLVESARRREALAKDFDNAANKNTGNKKRLRRAATGLLLAATVVAGARTMSDVSDSSSTEPVSTIGTDKSSEGPTTSIHTVEPLETPWGIAQEAHDNGYIDGDIRPTVDDISEQAGPDGLHPGEKVVITKSK